MKNDTYKEVIVFNYSNAVVRVHIPDITSEEKSRRMKEVERAAVKLILESRSKK